MYSKTDRQVLVSVQEIIDEAYLNLEDKGDLCEFHESLKGLLRVVKNHLYFEHYKTLYIEELGLGNRLVSALRRIDVRVVGDLYKPQGPVLKGIAGIGAKSLLDLKKKLKELGLELPQRKI